MHFFIGLKDVYLAGLIGSTVPVAVGFISLRLSLFLRRWRVDCHGHLDDYAKGADSATFP